MGLTFGSRTAAAWLRENLWQPIENRLPPQTKTVLISADGPLARLPFAALPGKEPGTYLIEDWSIAMIPAVQAVPSLLTSANQSPPGRFFLLGALDVDSSTRDAAPPSASLNAKKLEEIFRREFLTLRRIYEKRFTTRGMFAISSGNATEYSFRQNAPKYRHLHIAAHGMFGAEWARTALERSTYGSWPIDERKLLNSKSVEEFHPSLLSAIALAPSSLAAYEATNDGILSAEEIQTLDLRGADLVVLSSCQTALGEQADGDVLLGIQRAFHLAGAKTVISALWSPSAEVGEVLMERFYDNLWNKSLNKLAAFREAQLWLLREGRLEKLLYNGDQWPAEFKNRDRLPPFFWAGFVLSGDGLGRAAPVER
jgi:CHAT domain-containing protein